MPRRTTPLLAALILAVPVAAQAPKKPNPQQIMVATQALEKFGCKLHYDDKAPGGPADLVWFPEKTADADLVRMVGHAARLPGLKAVDLGETKVTDAGLKELARIPALESVYLDDTAVTDAGVKALANIPRLAWLDLTGTKVTAKSTDTLATCKTLHHLFLGRVALKKEEVDRLTTLAKLRSLGAGSVPDDSIPDLGKLADLRDLRLGGIGQKGGGDLGRLTRLEALTVRGGFTTLTADGWKAVTDLADLKSLEVGTFAPNDWAKYRTWDRKRKPAGFPAAAAALGDMRPLKKLDLTGLPIGDDALRPVGKLAALEELSLCCTLVTFEDAKDLAGLGKLKRLNARNTNVTDRGLRSLEALKELELLYLYDTSVTESGVNRLQKALPRCTIYWKYTKGKGDHHFRVPGGYGG